VREAILFSLVLSDLFELFSLYPGIYGVDSRPHSLFIACVRSCRSPICHSKSRVIPTSFIVANSKFQVA
jgi:hypothetical protein